MRADELQARLGDATDPGNPLGYAAVLAADERGELLAEGERMLDDYGLNAEFVPRSLGGRFVAADRFALTMRALFRRDPSLGLGYGVSSFIGAVPIWTSGSREQHRWVADLLLGGGRIAAGYTELSHGGDFGRAGLRAEPADGGYVLTGGKQLISNVARARALTLFARTDDAPGNRSHSHLLVDLAALPPELVSFSRFPTSGLRALLLGGVDFRGCAVPGESLVGEAGGAMESVLRAFQVTRSTLPGAAVGVLDTQLRLVTGFALERSLYGGPVADLPAARGVLVDAFLDLLICDCLAMVAARALHVLPGQAGVYAAAVKYLVPNLLHEANYALSTLLGARSYVREGPYGLFQKNTRDLSVAMLAHASSAACLATIIPQLPRLARQSWLSAQPPPPALFRLDERLPELDFSRLVLSARGMDNLSATVLLDAEPARHFAAELAELKKAVEAMGPRDRTVAAGPAGFELAARYARLLAACACLGVWWHGERDSWWIEAVLRRLGAPGEIDEGRVFAELRARHDDGRAFDLSGGRLAG